MIEIREMADIEVDGVLQRVCYGHLGCALDNRPYVVPVHYVYDKPFLYLYTNDGKKTEILRANPQVCLQVQEVADNGDWQSVVVDGEAVEVTSAAEIESVIRLISSRVPTPTPAMGITWVNNWVASKMERVFRIMPETLSGRTANKVNIATAAARPSGAKVSRIF